jgi:hypothetical protein
MFLTFATTAANAATFREASYKCYRSSDATQAFVAQIELFKDGSAGFDSTPFCIGNGTENYSLQEGTCPSRLCGSWKVDIDFNNIPSIFKMADIKVHLYSEASSNPSGTITYFKSEGVEPEVVQVSCEQVN